MLNSTLNPLYIINKHNVISKLPSYSIFILFIFVQCKKIYKSDKSLKSQNIKKEVSKENTIKEKIINDDTLLGKMLYDDVQYNKFKNFLTNIFKQINVNDFDKIVRIIKKEGLKSNQEIYNRIRNLSKKYKGNAINFSRKQLNALEKQRNALLKNTKKLVGKIKIDGVVEIGSPGAYLKRLKKELSITGRSYNVYDYESFMGYFQNFEFSLRNKFRSYDTFISLNNYNPLPINKIPSNSVDLIVCYIGLHHCPPEKLKDFVKSINRVLRPNGLFLLRDHNIISQEAFNQALAAHSVFNAISSDLSWKEEKDELRNFQTLDYFIEILEECGLKFSNKPGLIQKDDPTKNTLISFYKSEVPITSSHKPYIERIKKKSPIIKDPDVSMYKGFRKRKLFHQMGNFYIGYA